MTNGTAAFTVWLTGLSGSGKSTLARGLSDHLSAFGLRHERLDGDELRLTLCRDLGFSKADRNENVRRIARKARELNDGGSIAVVAAIAPYREARLGARQACGRFVEVFVDCSLDTLVQRDPKGLYARALAGQLANFSGVSDPYEAPEQPEIYVNSDSQSVEESLAIVVQRLTDLGYLVAKLGA